MRSPTCFRGCAGVVVLLAVVQVWQYKTGRGTLFAPLVLAYTAPYKPWYTVDPPMEPFTLPMRVVVSLTTMPENVKHLRDTLDSLLAQTILPNAIYINVPRINNRSGQPYPSEPVWLSEPAYASIVHWNVLERDYGPLTKLVGALLRENDPETIVVTVDDDKVYDKHLLRKLTWNSYKNENAAFGTCGWVHVRAPQPERFIPGYLVWAARGRGRYIDTLQACCGIAYRVGLFQTPKDPQLAILKNPPPECFTADDLWISGYLAAWRGVGQVLLGGNRRGPRGTGYDAMTPKWKRQASSSFALSSENAKPGHDAACIDAIEHRFQVQHFRGHWGV